MRQRLQSCHFPTVARLLLIGGAMLGILAPQPASAQQSDAWKMSLAPLYFWATSIDGEIATRAGTTPVSLSFDDAIDHLAGAFSFHFEAEKNRVGFFSDVDFVRLKTEADFTLQGPAARTVTGDADIANTFFEAGASYRLSDTTNVAVIGGVRAFTVSTEIEFSTPNVSVTPIDCQPHGGKRLRRPHLSAGPARKGHPDQPRGHRRRQRHVVVRRCSDSSTARNPGPAWCLGTTPSGSSSATETDDHDIRKADMTFHGPFFALNFHWGGR